LLKISLRFETKQSLERLSYLDACPSKIRLLENPFDSVTENLHSEVIDLQSTNIFKDKFKEGNLIEFFNFLPYDQYVHLRIFAHEFPPILGLSRPNCEQAF